MPVLVDSPFSEKMDISKVRPNFAEIAASSAAIDLGDKKRAYRNGVRGISSVAGV